MPNWCECELTVRGNSKIIQKMLDTVFTNEEMDANKIIPYPKNYREMDEAVAKWDRNHENDSRLPPNERPKDGYNSGGYEWCNENWGTKWGFCDFNISEVVTDSKDGYLYADFETAWTPPIPLIKKLSKMFPELEIYIEFFECGAAFQGKGTFINGEGEVEYKEYYGSRGG